MCTASILGILILLLYVVPVQLQAAVFPQNVLPQKLAEPAASAEQSNPESDINRIRKLLAEARSEFNKIDAPGALSLGAPPGTPTYGLMRRRFLLRQIAANYDRLLSELERNVILRSKRTNLDKKVLQDITANEKPPYSILLLERFRESVQKSQFKIKRGEIALETIAVKKSTLEDNLKNLEGEKRALLEQIEKESDPVKKSTLEWNKLISELNQKSFATALALLQASQKNTEEELAIDRKELSFLGDKLDEVSKNSRFTETDLNALKKGLEDRRSTLERELEQAHADHEALQRSAEMRLSIFKKKDAVTSGKRTQTKKDEVTRSEQLKDLIVQEELDNSIFRIELFRGMLELNRTELLIWELRYAAEVNKDKESIARLNRMIPQALEYFARQEESNSLDLNILLQKLNGIEAEMAQPVFAVNHDDLKRLIIIYKKREELLLSRIKAVTAGKSVFIRLSDQFSESSKHAVTEANLSNWRSSVRGIWSYELFATEDVYTVDGREIKGKRGVTIGKIASALALLVVGFIVSLKVTKFILRLVIKRYDVQEGGALLARRWILALIFIILLFTSLNLMRIPLTAFAFLGGAIAIGTGFGIQDLMKNLMSGLMMLAERPFRIGDLIDVNGVRGRVTSIGIRSSTIRDATGIETLVPNTTFVEKNVTNWTYSNHQVRYNIIVGVAYGSNIAVVKELLLRSATSHKDVLENPEPLVTLDDFGSDALVFGLYYWIGLDSFIDPKVIASDIRTSIEKNLTEEGIAISFPQRDIHIENLKPLQIEVVDSKSN